MTGRQGKTILLTLLDWQVITIRWTAETQHHCLMITWNTWNNKIKLRRGESVQNVLPYYVHKLQIPAASRSLPCGPCGPSAGSEGNEGYAAQTWRRCYPGYRLKPRQPRRWVRWCLGSKRVKIKGHRFHRNCGWLTYFLDLSTRPSITFKTTIDSLQTVCFLFYLY